MAIEGVDIVKAAAFLGAGISMGLGAIGPGVGEGMVAAKACEAIGKNLQVNRNMNVEVLGNASETITGTKDELVQGKNTKTGSEIDMDANPINLN